MMFKRFRFVSLIAALSVLSGTSTRAEDPKPNTRRVMTWVPPYAVDVCRERLNESYDGVGAADALTHLGLQFWQPTESGKAEVVSRFGKNTITDETIGQFRQWGNDNGVKVLLCVYNGTPSGWDWQLASSAFDINRSKFIEALVGEVLRLKLDGVDIDFEGKGDLEGSKLAFVRFIEELSKRLHAKGKELTVDTFAYKWNAPRQSWWPDLLPHIDGLHVMGYTQLGAGAKDWRDYAFVKEAAGKYSSKILVGVSGNADEWQGKPVEEHISWVVSDRSIGMAIWDAQFKAASWRTQKTWDSISKLKKENAGRAGK